MLRHDSDMNRLSATVERERMSLEEQARVCQSALQAGQNITVNLIELKGAIAAKANECDKIHANLIIPAEYRAIQLTDENVISAPTATAIAPIPLSAHSPMPSPSLYARMQ